MVGRTLAHYEILERIGSGGIGEVYRARDTKLDREIALKVLPAEWTDDPERRQHFEREARTVAALNHPNIVTIHSVEEADGVVFLTMELIRGQVLSELIPPRGLALDRFFTLAVPLADAVSRAHAANITHRDLKPTNVMVDDGGRLRVLDFGLAKSAVRQATEDGTAGASGLGSEGATVPLESDITGEGKILGTAAYMSPEQAQGKPLDQHSDVFSLGILFYEMLTGERPFKGDTQISTISSILKDTPPSVTQVKRTLPRHLGRIIKRCLAKEPERRYQSALELRNELQDLKEEIDSGELSLSPATVAEPRARRVLWLALAATGLAVTALVVTFSGVLKRPSIPEGDLLAASAIEIVPATNSGNAGDAAISPDGKYIAYVQSEKGMSSLHLKQLSTGSVAEVVSPSDAHLSSPQIPADGDYIFYLHRESGMEVVTICQVPMLGGQPRKLIDGVRDVLAVSPDGAQVAFARSVDDQTEIVVASVDGFEERTLLRRSLGHYGSMAWSPDGTEIAITDTASAGILDSGLAAVTLDGNRLRSLSVDTWVAVLSMAWLPGDRGIVLAGFRNFRFHEPARLWHVSATDGAVCPLTSGLTSYESVSTDRTGTLLAAVQQETELSMWVAPKAEPDSAHQFAIASRMAHWIASVSWLHDGRLIYEALEGEALHLYVSDPDGRNARPLTTDGEMNIGATVSPDGRSIAFLSNRSGRSRIWIADADGGDPRRLTNYSGDAEEVFPLYAPDGESILYHVVKKKNYSIWRASATGGAGVRLIEFNASLADISPDSEVFACRALTDRGASCIVTVSMENGTPIDTLGISSDVVRWARGGDALQIVRLEGGVDNIWQIPLGGGSPEPVTRFAEGRIADFAWSPSGDSLAVLRRETRRDVVLIRNFEGLN